MRLGDVLPTPSYGVEYHIHTGSQPPVFAKGRRLHPEKLEIAKAECKRLESAGIVRLSNHSGLPHCTWSSKKMDHGGLAAVTAVST